MFFEDGYDGEFETEKVHGGAEPLGEAPEDRMEDEAPGKDAPLRGITGPRPEPEEGRRFPGRGPCFPEGPRGRFPGPFGGWEPREGHPPMHPFGAEGYPPRGCGPVRPRRQPAFRPGFVPEEERRERYEGLNVGEKITFQIQSLSHLLHRMPESRDGQRRVMEILMEKGCLSQRELMELCDIRSGSLSELISKMEMNGYIARRPNPRDRRTLDVSLTEAGLLAAQTLQSRRQDLYEGISLEDQAALLRALEGLNRHFRERLNKAVPLEDKTRV